MDVLYRYCTGENGFSEGKSTRKINCRFTEKVTLDCLYLDIEQYRTIKLDVSKFDEKSVEHNTPREFSHKFIGIAPDYVV